ncbi:hypothetical protein IU459_16180 [Nocardia amamiensis]|uniref:Peptidase M3A/M3B catalytic domain-containing protein n=1 Tax=Nocardia amamiensis TaxID=404578 RepID=A0ABS0CW96_9NOCA|nr:M3 family metallopeptidase [Nocardia amamiensis]MBF6299068.1 hypothetical protein [Nocardia amamiensis]
MDKLINASERLAAALTTEATEFSQSLFRALTQPTEADGPYTAATAILSNIGHLLAYAEGNQRHIQFDMLDRWRVEHIDSFEWRLRLLTLLSDLPRDGTQYEDQHYAWVSMLRSTVGNHDPALIAEEQQLYSAVRGVRQGLSTDRSALLSRLGVSADGRNPETRFFRLMSRTGTSGLRTKLAAAWDRVSDRRATELVGILDEIVRLRWSAASRRGFGSPLVETFRRSTLTPNEARTFISGYVAEAVAGHRRLEAAVVKAVGHVDSPMDHYAYYVNQLTGTETLPLVPLDACLSLITAVIESVFRLSVEVSNSRSDDRIRLILKDDGRTLGHISIDLLPFVSSETNPVDVLETEGTGAQAPTLPIGRALCRYQVGADGSRLVNFESSHNLFHEMGHALTQVLVRNREPRLSGYEYLPVERLEDLSTWFEKWVYHPEFDARMPAGSSLAICRRIKLLESRAAHLQRAVTAAIDFDVHDRRVGLSESFRALDKEFDIAQYVQIGDIAGHLTHPMFRAYPGGAGLTYLWGAAFGADQFRKFEDASLSEVVSLDYSDHFQSCFDSRRPSELPDVLAVRQFYERALTV